MLKKNSQKHKKMAKIIIKKISCPSCGWVYYQTKNYGMESACPYICPECNNPNIKYQAMTSQKKIPMSFED